MKPSARNRGAVLLGRTASELGLTHEAIADFLGVHRNMVGRYIAGEAIPTLEVALRALDEFGIDPRTWLMSPTPARQSIGSVPAPESTRGEMRMHTRVCSQTSRGSYESSGRR